MDLIIRNARLADGQLSEPLDIGVAGGKIVAIESGLAGAAETYDAAGRLCRRDRDAHPSRQVGQKPGARSARCGRSRP